MHFTVIFMKLGQGIKKFFAPHLKEIILLKKLKFHVPIHKRIEQIWTNHATYLDRYTSYKLNIWDRGSTRSASTRRQGGDI